MQFKPFLRWILSMFMLLQSVSFAWSSPTSLSNIRDLKTNCASFPKLRCSGSFLVRRAQEGEVDHLSNNDKSTNKPSHINNEHLISSNDVASNIKSDRVRKLSRTFFTQNLVSRSITGVVLSIVATLWIASGKETFALGLLVASLIAQREYQHIVEATGVRPVFQISVLSTLLSFFTATFYPQLHGTVLPLTSSVLLFWLLLFQRYSPTIGEISTSLFGMFYLGHLPSFWVKLRDLEMNDILFTLFRYRQSSYGWNSRVTGMFRNELTQRWLHNWSYGSLVTWWTWVIIVAAGTNGRFSCV